MPDAEEKAFRRPLRPVLEAEPPSGPGWIHEVKATAGACSCTSMPTTLYSRRGNDLTKRFRFIRDAVLCLPCRSAIIDAELVVCDSDGRPDFKSLMARSDENLCAWCFDLLSLDGRDLKKEPLTAHKAILRDLLVEADDDTLRYSDEFPDAEKLFRVSEKIVLEGGESKKANQPYVSGRNVGWIKVKTASWRAANADRKESFQDR
jgi:bifunctional non-homologous end joining protein LigD